MSAIETELHAVVTRALAEDAVLSGCFGSPPRLYEQQRKRAVFPYLSWGRWDVRPRDGDAVELVELRASLHVWAGEEDVVALTGLLRARLQDLEPELPDPARGRLIIWDVPYSDVLRTRGFNARRGVVRVRALVEIKTMESFS